MAAPTWFWIVVAVFILWGLMGCWACYSQLTITPEKLAALPDAQRDAWTAQPGLVKFAYVVAVGAGLAGALLLAARMDAARWAFVVSLIAVVIQFGWFFGPYRGGQKLGWGTAGFPLFIVAMCVIQIWFTCFAAARGWIG
ncbi:hypothetical protein K7G82_04105 [Sphingomonas colocasiae]|uniref:DUF1761 domain-containing protein n=2 Tax=Sphingomonas colocasiae TaxID=1848973 RepID=A0ABS7PJL7_9SPHN|nr:hypothetical protein [Sphingomonas colocasiae]